MRAYEKPVITVDSGMAEKVWLWQTGPELMEPSL